MSAKVVLFSLLILSVDAQSQTLSFGQFDASNQAQFQYNLNAPGYNNPPNGALLLTQPKFNDAGSVFYLQTVSLENTASFSCAFSFMMDQGYGNDGTGSGADGLVFIINSVSNNGGVAGYGIGYAGIANSVGIEFDTWYNPDFGDISGNHIGIDTNGNIRSILQKHSTDLFNNGAQYYAWVDFDGSSKTLEVRYSLTTTRPDAAFISGNVDVAAILGKNQVYIGFSSATGGAYERTRVMSWAFTNTYQPIATVPTAAPASTCGNNNVEAGEQCDGGACCTSTCTFAAATTTCRAATGSCDVAETCTGSSSSCPANAFAPSSKVCRPAANSCDFAESCTGSSDSCPADVVSQTAPCFCGRQNLADGQMEYYCDATGGFYQCLGGVYASQSRDMQCGAGTQCGCDFGQACSCNLQQSPCVWAGTRQQC